MSGKPLYVRTKPMELFHVETRGDLLVIVGPGLEWHNHQDANRQRVDSTCEILNHAALMGWQECHRTMMTSSKNTN